MEDDRPEGWQACEGETLALYTHRQFTEPLLTLSSNDRLANSTRRSIFLISLARPRPVRSVDNVVDVVDGPA